MINTPLSSGLGGAGFFNGPVPAITFSIPFASTKTEKYTLYNLKMQTQYGTWDVDKRYSEFHNVH